MNSVDPRGDEELQRTQQAQEAHGGSMAPGLVDETGHQVGKAGTTGPGATSDDAGAPAGGSGADPDR